jgi:membrane associated rhomboid family serine protease
MSRRRTRHGRRPRFFAAVLTAAVIGGLLYVALSQYAHMNGNAAGLCTGIAIGWLLRHNVRIPSMRITWRRR